MRKQQGRWYVLGWDDYCHRMASDTASICGNQTAPAACWKQWCITDAKNHGKCPD